MSTVTITIGSKVGEVSLPAKRWSAFKRYVDREVLVDADEVYVRLAKGVGSWTNEDGTTVIEENATWVAAVPEHNLERLSDALSVFAKAYGQEAIALTVGSTELVAPSKEVVFA